MKRKWLKGMKGKHGQVNIKGGGENEEFAKTWWNWFLVEHAEGKLSLMQISLRRNLYTHQVGEVIALKWSNIFPFYINILKRVEDKNKYILT